MCLGVSRYGMEITNQLAVINQCAMTDKWKHRTTCDGVPSYEITHLFVSNMLLIIYNLFRTLKLKKTH